MRFNTFNQIHKALRALLYDAALTLQQTSFSNPDEAEDALEKLRIVLDVFDKHAQHEDHFILPAIQQYEPSIADSFEQEHVEDHELAEKLRNLMLLFEKQQDPRKKEETGHAILHAFIAFLSFNLDHMAKEETVLNDRLWRYYSDAEIIALNQKIVASIPPAEMQFTAAWMMKGMNNTEITGWLKVVQKTAPEVVFSMLFSIAEKELPAMRFRRILEDLTEGAMIA
ncbi:MAG TPA: hemerythrin domain-containing protein [Chitinophagaceae bacterium]|jgi:hypothetical protein|nr:hemerythrin domain-containing protein [Chitinophagaceae bacterium]